MGQASPPSAGKRPGEDPGNKSLSWSLTSEQDLLFYVAGVENILEIREVKNNEQEILEEMFLITSIFQDLHPSLVNVPTPSRVSEADANPRGIFTR
uniref:Uncharacterized protein n=1 Tax=Colobus angolensis palliatus TaxID=336983 RepID=A0A2K5J5U5_COLAP